MYSISQRFSSVFGFFTTCLSCILPLIAAWNYFMFRTPPSIDLSVDRINVYRGLEDYYIKSNSWIGDMRLSIHGDFSSQFHWNVKQIFLYAVVEYATSANPRNQVTIWDKIMPASGYHRIDADGIKAKYQLSDLADQLPGTEAELKLYWDTVPHVGRLFAVQSGMTKIKIPSV